MKEYLYGINPAFEVVRAKEILLNLEEGEFSEAGQPKIAVHRQRKTKAACPSSEKGFLADGIIRQKIVFQIQF